MGIYESIGVCINGLFVVLTILATLALATIVIASIVQRLVPEKATASSNPSSFGGQARLAAAETEDFGELFAVLHGALSLETGIPPEQIVIKSISRID